MLGELAGWLVGGCKKYFLSCTFKGAGVSDWSRCE